MADRLLVDLTAGGQVSVGTWLDGELPGEGAGKQRRLVWPLDPDALEELRWYLEDYLRAPFGVYEGRGPEVRARLAPWGEAVFKAVFGLGPARDAYQRMRAGAADVQVVFRSGSALVLALPWELMRDPASDLPLALEAAGIDRSLPTAELSASFDLPASGRLRVLMVISRPAGAGDVGYRMIARPLLDRLQAVRGQVDLVVLRPPTLDALAESLTAAAEAGEPFQVVHFDGHGMLADRRAANAGTPSTIQGPGPEGMLVFEQPGGGPAAIPAARVAQVLKAARVPVAVLNACQSGAIGKELEAAVATRLLQEGIASVVAMAYTVYAVAAAEFMAAFYERLFAGETVSAAVTAGRQRLYHHDGRPSPKGDMPLADWVVPVHYLRQEVRFPGLVTTRSASEPSLDEALNRLRGRGQSNGSTELAPVGVFTGRDGLFYELEAAARLQGVVVLHGAAGTGKTELAKAFGRWWQATGGVERPEWVFWHSFEPGLASFGLDGVVAEIGLAVFGTDFAQLDEIARVEVVQEFLRDRRALLIWDNFESVRSVPDPSATTPPLDHAGCQRLSSFLGWLAGGKRSAVLVTSRSEEAWLDEVGTPSPGGGANPVSLCRIQVPGLAAGEAADYAGELLAPYPAAAPRRAARAFGELMEWLDGHPLSMRVVLPHLDTTEPAALLDGLRGIAPLPGWDDGGPDRANSLLASLSYSFIHLDPAVRRLLAAVCLLHGTADADVLGVFSSVDSVPKRFRSIGREAWDSALDAAAAAGLLTRLGGGMYRIHPALPAYLAAFWRDEDPTGYENLRAAAIKALLAAYAAFGRWLSQEIASGEAELAYSLIGLQQQSMGHLLGYALDGMHWELGGAIAQPLEHFLNVRGLGEEADAWADRVRLVTEGPGGEPPELGSPAGFLWAFYVGEQANRQARHHHLDRAERMYKRLLAGLEDAPASRWQRGHLATVNQQLGNVAFRRGRLEDAESWYSRSCAIREELGDRPGLATSYNHFGNLAIRRGQLEDAETWYSKSRDIREELGDRPGLANSYQQLAHVADRRGRLDQAEVWYGRSLTIRMELHDRVGIGMTYQGLGELAHGRGRLNDAEDWCRQALIVMEEIDDRPGLAGTFGLLGLISLSRGRLTEAADWHLKALAIEEELSDQPGIAHSCHQLGLLAQYRGQLEEAADWYARSLAVNEALGNQLAMAPTLEELGIVAEEQGDPGRALEWTVRRVALLEKFPDHSAGPAPDRLARLGHQLGTHAVEACWQQVTGHPLPRAVRDYIRSCRPGTDSKSGEGE